MSATLPPDLGVALHAGTPAADAPAAALAAWCARVAAVPPVLELPGDGVRPARVAGAARARTEHRGDTTVTSLLAAFARAWRTTPGAVVQAALEVVVARWTARDDFLLAVHDTATDDGWRVAHATLAGGPTFAARVRAVREAPAAPAVSPRALAAALALAPDPSRAALVQLRYAWCDDAAHGTPAHGDADLLVTATVRDGTLVLVADHLAPLLGAAPVGRLLHHVEVVLAAALRRPDTPVTRLPLLDTDERRLVLERFNDTARTHPPTSLVALVAAQVARTPQATALVARDGALTYAELDARATTLARTLVQRGATTETPVAVCLPRSPDLVVALLAVLRAGAAYVPLDPAYPLSRLQFLLDDTGAPLLVSARDCEAATFLEGPARLDLDDPATWSAADVPLPAIDPAQLAYWIYTSGSTGVPKGVQVEHRNAGALVHWALGAFGRDDLAGVYAATSVCFDLSIFELFVTLAAGGTIVLGADALDLATHPARDRVTLVNTVPSAARALLGARALPASVRVVNLAGEPLAPELVDALYDTGTVRDVHDLYGPSEDTTYSTWIRREAGGPATIGRPIDDTEAFVLDAAGEPVPLGVPGELYLGGTGVTRGYWRRPELTAERFVPNPLPEGRARRLYRTGDRVRWRDDGTLEFLGRLDDQVKLRGYRIELGEVGAALRALPGVADAVAAVQDPQSDRAMLVGYVVPTPGTCDDAEWLESLRLQLLDELPRPYVPSRLVALARLPLGATGKVDRKALPRVGDSGAALPHADDGSAPAGSAAPTPAPPAQVPAPPQSVTAHEEARAEEASADTTFEAPGDETPAPDPTSRTRPASAAANAPGGAPVTLPELGALWQRILRVEAVHPDDDFFALGGTSLDAARLLGAVRGRTGRVIPLATLANAPTLAAFAAALDAPPLRSIVTIKPGRVRRPFFCVHGVGGLVLEFHPLVRHVHPDQPLYGVQAVGLYRDDYPHDSVEGMARDYVAEIRAVQPRGPYFVGGSSFGGMIAFEIAHQLVAAGERVEALVLFDTWAPGSWTKLRHRGRVARFVDRVRTHGSNFVACEDTGARVRYLRDKWGRLRDRIRMQLREARVLAASPDLHAIRRRGVDAMYRYVPGPYDGPVVLLRATEQPPLTVDDRTNGWSAFVRGPLTVLDVPGHHGAIMHEPRTRHLAAQLTVALADAEARCAAAGVGWGRARGDAPPTAARAS